MKKVLASAVLAAALAGAVPAAQAQGLGGGFDLSGGVGTGLAVAGGLMVIGAVAIANGSDGGGSPATTTTATTAN